MDCERRPIAKDDVIQYLSSRKAQDLLRLIISHLAVSRPDDPVTFLSDLLQRALQYRNAVEEGQGTLDVLDHGLSLFQAKHIEAIFNAMDPFRKGSISLIQYHNGMGTMGIVEYEMSPSTDSSGNVAKETFMLET